MRVSFLRAYLAGLTFASLLAGRDVYVQDLAPRPVGGLLQVSPKDLRLQQEAYMQAMDEWQKGDLTLEKDLHSGDRKTLLERIDQEAARTARFLESKKTYFGYLRQYYQDQFVAVEGSVGPGAKPPQTREEIQEQIDGVSRERLDLDERIDNTQEAEVRQKLIMQRGALKSIQDNLQEQKALVDKWERGEGDIRKSRDAIKASVKRITDILAEQETGTADTQAQMNRVFASMREVAGTPVKQTTTGRPGVIASTVATPPTDAPTPAGTTPPTGARTSAGAASPTSAAPPKGPATPTGVIASKGAAAPTSATTPMDRAFSFAGSWKFTAKKGETEKPQSITLEITEAGDMIGGILVASRVPPSLGLGLTVRIEFAGPKGGYLQSTSENFRSRVELFGTPNPSQMALLWKNDTGAVIYFQDFVNRR